MTRVGGEEGFRGVKVRDLEIECLRGIAREDTNKKRERE